MRNRPRSRVDKCGWRYTPCGSKYDAGKGKLQLTGNLGDVMKESAQIAISYVRSISNRYNIKEDYFEKHDIHIHVPEGAVPKDGHQQALR